MIVFERCRSVAMGIGFLLVMAAQLSGQHRLDLVSDVRTLGSPPVAGSGRGLGVSGGSGGKLLVVDVEVKLVAFDHSELRLGETAIYEVSLRNTGKRVVTLPWSKDPMDTIGSRSPAEARMRVYLSMRDGAGRFHHVTGVTLFGSSAIEGTTVDLLPGETAVVRAAGPIIVDGDREHEIAGSVTIHGGFWLSPRPGFWAEPILSMDGKSIRVAR